MGEDRQTLLRLLNTKDALGLAGKRESSPQDHGRSGFPELDDNSHAPAEKHEFGSHGRDESGFPEMACISCGYSQHGQLVDRCPECSLPLASRLTDPTFWSSSNATIINWWKTASSVWKWDRRTRIRISYIPVNPKSRRFAKWSLLMTAPFLGMAVAVVNQLSSGPRALVACYFILLALIATVLAGLLLAGTLFGLTLVLEGTWRRRLRFVPASVDYATAWWPPVAAVAFVVSCLHAARGDSAATSLWILFLVGVVLWGLWLWGSATECQHVFHVGPRIIVVLLGLGAVGLALLLAIPGQTRKVATQALVLADSGLLRLKLFGTFNAGLASSGPQVYALVIDNILSDDEPLILGRLAALGAGAKTRVEIRGKECTLEQFDKAFDAVRQDLNPQDRFILYINGRGSPSGSGSIRMADGDITYKELADQLRQLPTKRSLVVIDSSFGGKCLPVLQDTCSATVITWTDDHSRGSGLNLKKFWDALGDAHNDGNMDGKVSVDEAFRSAYRDVLERAEKDREKALLRIPSLLSPTGSVADPGYATPQLEMIGEAGEDDFFVPLPQQKKP